MKTTPAKPLYRVGDQVKVRWGGDWIVSKITEVRGTVGGGRRRLYQVSVPSDPFDPIVSEWPEEELQPYDPVREPPHQLTKREIMDYLKQGGLIAILLHQPEGRYQPPVWLRPTERGGVIHTFDPERGQVGGRTIPPQATRRTKVFAPKRAEVAEFLRSFGLTAEEADEVLDAVGIATR